MTAFRQLFNLVAGAAPIENGIYVLSGVVPSAIAAAPVPIKVVEATSDGQGAFYTPANVATMMASGGTLLGYSDFGFCESYRPYYNAANAASMGWTGPTAVENGLIINPTKPVFGNGASAEYSVAFFNPIWQQICFDWVDKLIAAGWSGYYFDVVDGWNYTDTPNDPVVLAAGGETASANDMITLLGNIRAHARAQVPNFQCWCNGGEELFAYGTGPTSYSNTFDGMLKEQVCYASFNHANNTANRNAEVALLNNCTAAGKPLILIEYVDNPSNVPVSTTEMNDVKSFCAANGYGYYIAASNQNLSGVDSFGF